MERSGWTLALMATSLVLLGAAFVLPWYAFHHSPGKETPPGAPPQEPETRDITYGPFLVQGAASEQQREDAKDEVRTLGILLAVSAGTAAANLGLEAFFGTRERTRTTQLWLTAVGFASAAAALVYAWFALPALLAGEGVTQVFTTRNDQDTFIRSTLSWGWVSGAVALVTNAGTFAFKFAGGVFSLSFLDEYGTRPE